MMLHIATYLPAFFALLLLGVRKDNRGVVTAIGVVATLSTLAATVALALGFERGADGYAYASTSTWLPTLGARYAVAVDGISLALLLLIGCLAPLTYLASTSSIEDRFRDFTFWFLLLQTFMMGAVTARDLFLFFLWWELLLLPMLFLIGRWGGKNRHYAALKFFIYTMVGSLPMLAALLWLHGKARTDLGTATFLVSDFLKLDLTVEQQVWCFLGFAASFAIKVPLFPVHSWLPDAHTEAPTPGSIALAGVLLKLGGYGFLVFALPLFPVAAKLCAPTLLTLSVIGVIYGALVAMVQKDLKRLVAFSSVSHMGIVTMGLFALNETGMTGSIVQMVAHGVSTGALFLLVGYLYERRHTRLLEKFGGVAKAMPVFATIFLAVAFSSIALPGTNGFIGEFMILLGTWQASPWHTVFAVTGAILGAWYLLGAVKQVFFGEAHLAENRVLEDVTRREILLAAPFLVAIIWFGVYPKPLIDLVKPECARLEAHVAKAVSAHAATKGD